jgi:hypothetical protein
MTMVDLTTIDHATKCAILFALASNGTANLARGHPNFIPVSGGTTR